MFCCAHSFLRQCSNIGKRMVVGVKQTWVRIMSRPLSSYPALDRFWTSLSFSFLVCKNGDNDIYDYKSKSLLGGVHTVKISRLMFTRSYSKCGYGNVFVAMGAPHVSLSFLIHQIKGWNHQLLKSEQAWCLMDAFTRSSQQSYEVGSISIL